MAFDRLKGIGFTDSEVKIYELLIREGECPKEELSRKAALGKAKFDGALSGLASHGAIEVSDKIVAAVSPRTFLQKYLTNREVDLELQMAEVKRNISEIQGILDPIYSESKYGLRLEELWQIIDGLPAMEMETIKMISRAKSEICILTERFSWYYKVREELLSALDRKVSVKVLTLETDKETQERVEDMKGCGISVRRAKCEWRSIRFTLVDSNELVFLIWAKKSNESRVSYRPGYTKNPGLLGVFCDSFQHLWEKAKPL
jgi:sugar-specific transcriptional regulator TrmB